MATCSIVMPAYNRSALTRRCLNELLGPAGSEQIAEIIVVNDCSTDDTASMLEEIAGRVIAINHPENKGFSTTCNDGARAATGDYVVFLNNDTIPQPGWIDALIQFAEDHPNAAVVGSKLLFPNDTIQHAGVVICHDRYPRHLYMGFPQDHPVVNVSRRFQIITAAAILVRPHAFWDAGGFDTSYFNGYEDVELCLKLGELGWELWYCHESVLYHLESVSENRFDALTNNTKLYMERWAPRVQPDEFDYYVQDGMLGIRYSDFDLYPHTIDVSPWIGKLETTEREREIGRILGARARQVHDLLKDNILLNVRLQEAAFRGTHDGRVSTTAQPDPKLLFRGRVRWQSKDSTGRLVSIVLPVKDGADKLRELLPRLLSQRIHDNIEIVAVDSGSTDGTIDVLRDFGATVVAIDPAAFNHGLTRNIAAQYAEGEIVVFVGKNLMPTDDRWLANLIAPLDEDPDIAGVCSRVIPSPDADPLQIRRGYLDPSSSPDRSVRVVEDVDAYRAMSDVDRRLLVNFHTVGAAIRADVLRKIPFKQVVIGEDVLWAQEALEAGFKLCHQSAAVVLHDHKADVLDILRLNVDDGRANREIVGRLLPDEEVAPMIRSLVQQDWMYLEEQGFKGDELEKWKLEAAMRWSAHVFGQWIGVNSVDTDDAMSLLSHTERLKRYSVGDAEANG